MDIAYRTEVRELITYMMEDPRSISRVINVLWTLRSLERIGDHAKNICEQVVYLVEGGNIFHGHENKLKKMIRIVPDFIIRQILIKGRILRPFLYNQ